jgi:competence protein ComEA
MAAVAKRRPRVAAVAVIAALAAVVAASILAGHFLAAPPSTAAELSLPRVTVETKARATNTTATTVATATVTVQAAGEVVHPGVYRLASSARVADLLAAAGGATAKGDPGALDLAAHLVDGERVAVPAIGQPPASGGPGGAGTTSPQPVNLNTATLAELDTLPGVGPATAAAIVAYRERHGPFRSVDQLGEVRGMGPARLEALRGLVTV